MFCKHKWDKITEYVSDSKLDNMIKNDFRPDYVVESFISKKFICILQCTECGKIRKIVESI